MPDLERQLTGLAGAIDWPPTPRLNVVLPIYGEVAGVAGRRGWRRWPYALAAGVLIVARERSATTVPAAACIARGARVAIVARRSVLLCNISALTSPVYAPDFLSETVRITASVNCSHPFP